MISDPQDGYNGSLVYTPGTTYEVRNWDTGVVALNTSGLPVRGKPTPWNAGVKHAQSGDKVWWYYFSDLQTPGSYYIYDTTTQKASARFEIKNQPFQDVMKAAMRMFFYQRAGIAKKSVNSDPGFTDAASHLQDQFATPAPLYNLNSTTLQRTRINSTAITQKDLRGGWYDAGDYNKYVNYIWEPMLDLLLAYEERPSVWTLNLNIPESTNTLPDILDEVKYELDWLLKMQAATGDGSVLSVVGTEDYAAASPPSMDKNLAGQNVGADGKNHNRYYGRATTMATYTAASVFALASIQFRSVGQTAYANQLLTAANNAWNWATRHPGVVFNNNFSFNDIYSDSYFYDASGSGTLSPTSYSNVNFVAAGNQEIGNGANWAVDPRHYTAAVYLFAASKAAGVTPIASYQQFIDNNWNNIFNNTMGVSSGSLQIADASLYYTKTIGATAAAKTAILDRYTTSMVNAPNNLPSYYNAKDAYLSYISDYNWNANPPGFTSEYSWGSNVVVAHQAATFLNMMTYNLDPTRYWTYYNAAAGYLHYFHGVNPNSKVYLTNMGQYGAENSVTSLYHNWFTDGSLQWDEVGVSTYGPAPGYVPGGPNQFYAQNTPCSTANPPIECLSLSLTPPLNQPAQKSWKDFNNAWPAHSWVVTEPQIYSQAAYIRMLSKFM